LSEFGSWALDKVADAIAYAVITAVLVLTYGGIAITLHLSVTNALLIVIASGLVALPVLYVVRRYVLKNVLDRLPFYPNPQESDDMIDKAKKMIQVLGGTLDHFHNKDYPDNARDKVMKAIIDRDISFEFVIIDERNSFVDDFRNAGLYTPNVTRKALHDALTNLTGMKDELKDVDGTDKSGKLRIKTTMLPIVYSLVIKDVSDGSAEIHYSPWNYLTRRGSRPTFVIRKSRHYRAFEKYQSSYDAITGNPQTQDYPKVG
jgi:hypothetical protein